MGLTIGLARFRLTSGVPFNLDKQYIYNDGTKHHKLVLEFLQVVHDLAPKQLKYRFRCGSPVTFGISLD